MPTNGFSVKPLKVKLLAGEQKATELRRLFGAKSLDVRNGSNRETVHRGIFEGVVA